MRKQILVLGLSLMSFSTFANTTDITVCLKQLNNANIQITSLQSELRSCQTTSRPGSGPVGGREDANLREQLRAERQRSFELDQTIKGLQDQYSTLQRQNSDLQRDNRELRDRIQDLERYGNGPVRPGNGGHGPGRGQALSYVAVGGCLTSSGNISLNTVVSSEASKKTEAETKSLSLLRGQCSYGSAIYKTAEVRTTNAQANYCSVGCLTSSGTVSSNNIRGAAGRNLVEAEFNAVKQLKGQCAYGIGVISCE